MWTALPGAPSCEGISIVQQVAAQAHRAAKGSSIPTAYIASLLAHSMDAVQSPKDAAMHGASYKLARPRACGQHSQLAGAAQAGLDDVQLVAPEA